MAFGRRKAQPVEHSSEEFQDDLSAEERAREDAELLADLEQQERVAPARPQGPWDLADAPPAGELPRLDLGSLQLPIPPETEVRVDVSPEGEVIAATLVQGESALQLNAFAAPRTQGIWAEVRAEIQSSLLGGGGAAEQAEGPFGAELRATVPTEIPDHGIVLAPARFVGVDGPRWFLRGLLTGPAAVDPVQAAGLEAALRDVVVVRGQDPMAVRDALPLLLPAEALSAEGLPPADTDPENPLQLPARGPEITETY